MTHRARSRQSTTERGYGHQHRKARAQWARSVERGSVRCWRCGRVIHPAAPWDLGHDDYDRSRYRGPEHRACNRGAAAVKGNRSRARRRLFIRRLTGEDRGRDTGETELTW